jgi:putative ABC transport system permease protein
MSYRLRGELNIIEGRAATPGTDEVVIGKALRGRFAGLDLDQSFDLKKNRPVKVVGVFDGHGSGFDSEVWADLDTLRSTFGRDGVASSVIVQLDSQAAYDGFKAAVEHDKQLGLEPFRESEYYEKQSEGTSIFVTALGVVVTFFFSLGAMIGAMITMYAAVAHRKREIGCLRALGFGKLSIMASFLFESVALAGLGGVLGALGSCAMGLVSFSVVNFQSWSEMVFRFEPTPASVGTGFSFAVVMGVLGGFFPALRAARMPLVSALKD